MTAFIDHDAMAQFIENAHVREPYPRQVVVDFGRPGMRWALSIREIIHWLAYRFDTNCDDMIMNHRLAVVLRSICEQFYPPLDDDTEWLIEELQDQGCTDSFEFKDAEMPDVDIRLLDLEEGFVVCPATFGEAIWSDQKVHPALARNARLHLDIELPSVVFDWFGIRGLRLQTVDLINLIASTIDIAEMAYQDQDAWLDRLELSLARNKANYEFRRDADLRARYGDDRVDDARNHDPGHRGTTSPEEQDAILNELDALI